MNEDKITADLRELFENEVRSSPAEHPEKTSRCLPISGFSESAQKAWTDGDRDHVSGCSFCRKTLVYHWERHAPQLWGLAQFLAEVHPQSEAMQLYLERNAEVRRTLDNSLLMRSIAAAWPRVPVRFRLWPGPQPSPVRLQLHAAVSVTGSPSGSSASG